MSESSDRRGPGLLREPVLLVAAVALLLGALASSWRAFADDRGPGAWVAAMVTLVVGLALVVGPLRRGWILSVASVTGAVLLLAFWLKWLLATPPLVYLHPVRYDADAALTVCAVFAACFAASWWGMFTASERWQFGAFRHLSVTIESAPRPRAVLAAFAVGVVLLLVRVGIAKTWDVGVPGKVPQTISVPLVLSGLYYVSTYAPLILAFYGLRGPGRLRVCGIGLLVGYALVGVVLGERSYAISAAVVMLYYYVAQSRRAWGSTSVARRLVVPAVIVVGAALALWVTLQLRPDGSSGGGLDALAGFVSDRVGGLNFLSPVMPVVQDTGTSVSRLTPPTWDSFLLVDVYGYPPSTVNGVAGTLLGLAYASAGFAGVVLIAVLTGAVAGTADGLLRSRASLAAMCHLGALLAWLNLLLEGTVKPAAIMFTVFITTACVLALLDRHHLTRATPHERGGQRIDHQ